MKNSLRKYVLFLILGFALINVKANDFWLNNSISTQVEGMIRYGDVETSLYTGRVNVSVPFYSLKDPDFKLDIILSYNSDGFKPFKSSGWVGYNWYLQVGGCVTREVKGYADDACRLGNSAGNTSNTGSITVGMYHYLCNRGHIANGNQNDIDCLPDIWRFNFFGYQGTFIINNDGKVKIVSGDYVEVDLSRTLDESIGISAESGQICPIQNNDSSQITIKTKDGYTYVFGGRLSALEYTYALANQDQGINQIPPTISSWHLSRVIAPNGRTMNYYYKGYGNNDEESSTANRNSLRVFNMYYSFFEFDSWQDGIKWSHPNVETITNDNRYKRNIKFCETKGCVLDSIRISGKSPLRILFCNDIKRRNGSRSGFSKMHDNYMLDSLFVYSGNRLIKDVHLVYQQRPLYSTATSYWQLLDKVTVSGVGEYSFIYDNSFSLPNIHIVDNGEYYSMVDINDYYKSNPELVTLQEIHYPTGGYQRYRYESHDYGTERRWRTYDGSRTNVRLLSHEVGLLKTGGCRISQIETYDSDKRLVEKRLYNYRRPNSNNTSSGVLYENFLVAMNDNADYWITASTANYSFLDTHIGYSHVEECVKDGNGVDLYRNTYSFDTGIGFRSPDNTVVGAERYTLFSGFLTFDSKICIKGKLLSQNLYSGNRLIKSVQYDYNEVPKLTTENSNRLGCTDTIVVSSKYGGDVAIRKLYIYPDVLTSQIISDCGNDESAVVKIIRNYSYDRKLRLKTETMTDSRKNEHFTKYTYPDMICKETANDTLAWSMLVKTNRINTPVECVSGFISNGSEYITSGTVNLYVKGRGATDNPLTLQPSSRMPSILGVGNMTGNWSDGAIGGQLVTEVVDYPYLSQTLSLTFL